MDPQLFTRIVWIWSDLSTADRRRFIAMANDFQREIRGDRNAPDLDEPQGVGRGRGYQPRGRGRGGRGGGRGGRGRGRGGGPSSTPSGTTSPEPTPSPRSEPAERTPTVEEISKPVRPKINLKKT